MLEDILNQGALCAYLGLHATGDILFVHGIWKSRSDLKKSLVKTLYQEMLYKWLPPQAGMLVLAGAYSAYRALS